MGGNSCRRVTVVVSQHESNCRSSAVDAAGLNTAVNPALGHWQSTQRTVNRVGVGVYGWQKEISLYFTVVLAQIHQKLPWFKPDTLLLVTCSALDRLVGPRVPSVLGKDYIQKNMQLLWAMRRKVV